MVSGLAILVALAPPVKLADGKVTAEALSDAVEVRAGDGFRVGVLLRMEPEWHIYWQNPGEAGMSTELTFRGAGVDVGPVAWPAPARLLSRDGFITTYGYEGEVLLSAPARARASGELQVDVSLLVCKVDCIPGDATLSIPITVGAETKRSAAAARFEAEVPRVPRPAVGLTTRIVPEAVRPGDAFTVEIAGACASRCRPAAAPFFPHRTPSVELEARGGRADGDRFVVTVAGRAGPDDPKADQRIAGVLAFDDAPPLEWSATLRRVGAPAPAAPAGPPLLALLGLAFLGGLILNLMPCVLPVLAIKVVGFARSAGAHRLAHGAAYALGVQAALALAAAAVLVLRAAGTEVGWGFQFQQPIFVAVVGAILVLLAENAFGVLELGVPATGAVAAVSRARGLARSAGEGALAVVLATPCSAPFLGTAVGVALASPAPVVVLVFVALGLGLGAPFVLLTLVPGARRLVPKPGAWMGRLKEILGFALLGACAWLLWIYGRQSGGAVGLVVLWLLVAFGGWMVGRWRRSWLALAAAAVLVGGWGYLTFAPRRAATGLPWRAYDEGAIATDVAAGRPVFVDFTADWCITCKVNERVAIDTDAVKQKVAHTKAALYRADFTRPDEPIRRALARFSKAGVPMYLVYSPASPDAPEVLPELLTENRVLEALDRASQRRIE